jgi:hypothetical protein
MHGNPSRLASKTRRLEQVPLKFTVQHRTMPLKVGCRGVSPEYTDTANSQVQNQIMQRPEWDALVQSLTAPTRTNAGRWEISRVVHSSGLRPSLLTLAASQLSFPAYSARALRCKFAPRPSRLHAGLPRPFQPLVAYGCALTCSGSWIGWMARIRLLCCCDARVLS